MSFLYTGFVNGLFDYTLYPNYFDLSGSYTIGLALLDTSLYVADQDADFNLSDIPSVAIVATGTPSGIVIANRTFTFDPLTFPALTGAEISAAALYFDNASDPTTSQLVAYIDAFAAGMPWTPDGTDWDFNPDPTGLVLL